MSRCAHTPRRSTGFLLRSRRGDQPVNPTGPMPVLHRRGMATMLAISLIGLAGMAATAIAWRLTYESSTRRTDRVQAELRQLLIAGAADSPRLFTEHRDEWQVPLPPHLAARGGSVTLHMLPPQRDLERLIQVEATLDHTIMRQTLRYARVQQGWGLVEAKLGNEPRK